MHHTRILNSGIAHILASQLISEPLHVRAVQVDIPAVCSDIREALMGRQCSALIHLRGKIKSVVNCVSLIETWGLLTPEISLTLKLYSDKM